MKRRPEPARFKRATSRPTCLCGAAADSFLYSIRALRLSVSPRARSGVRRARPAPPRGLQAGFQFRSTESPLSVRSALCEGMRLCCCAACRRPARPLTAASRVPRARPLAFVAFAGVLPSCSFIITHSAHFVNRFFTFFENYFYTYEILSLSRNYNAELFAIRRKS